MEIKLKKQLSVIIIVFLCPFINLIHAQEEDSLYENSTEKIEVYLIDNYVKVNGVKELILSWMTNIPVKSKVKINDIGEFTCSDSLQEFHTFNLNLSQFNLSKDEYMFTIISEDETGEVFESEEYSFSIPTETIVPTRIEEKKYGFYLYNCLLGGTFWLIPSPAIAIENSNLKFALVKDLPLLSFGSSSAYKSYPYGYIYAGYSHIFRGILQNSFRYGYKHLIEVQKHKNFVSLGIGGFSNFKGMNGFSTEVGISLLKILNSFELYGGYSFNIIPEKNYKLHLFQIGLYTSSFSININF